MLPNKNGNGPDLNKSFFEENELSATPCSLKNKKINNQSNFCITVVLKEVKCR